jgi:spore germination protein YaaH
VWIRRKIRAWHSDPVRIAAVAVTASLALLVAGPAPGADRPRRAGELASTGYILGGTPDRVVARDAHALATLGVAGVAITPDGRDVEVPRRDVRHLVATAHDHGLRAELLVHNVSDVTGDFDPDAAAALLRHPQRIRAVAASLAQFVADDGWDGIHIDLEAMSRKDGAGLVTFAEELQARMPAEKTVSLAMSASTERRAYRARGYRLAPLAAVLDTVALMTYDQHGPTWSGPGPIGALPWQRRAVAAALEKIPEAKLDLGIAGYGYSWPRNGTGRSLTLRQVRRLVAADGATPTWRPGAGEWTARLSNGTVLWWSDGDSYELRLELAASLGLHGTALWRLGSADPLP